MRKTIFLSLLSLSLLPGCVKKLINESGNNCEKIRQASLSSNSPVTVGQTIKFGTEEVGGYRIYDWTGPNYYDGQEPSDSITYAELKHEGWYYLYLYSLDGDCEKQDSVYIDVKLQQGAPACSITNNTTTYSNMGDDSFTSVFKTIDAGSQLKKLAATATGGGNITIFFHPRWKNIEPEDGIYTTINTQVFDQIDNNYNKVFVTTTKNSIYWACRENQNVYITHVNGKLQVRFCSLTMLGNGFTTSASGNVVQL